MPEETKPAEANRRNHFLDQWDGGSGQRIVPFGQTPAGASKDAEDQSGENSETIQRLIDRIKTV